MKKYLVVVTVLWLAVSGNPALAKDFILDFSKSAYSQCDSNVQSKQSVLFTPSSLGSIPIQWTWDASEGHCKWALPMPGDISEYIAGLLVISVAEEFHKGTISPEISLIDDKGNHTPLVKIYRYLSDGQLLIPLTDFNLTTIDTKNVAYLQFNVPWNRNNEGRLFIKSLKLATSTVIPPINKVKMTSIIQNVGREIDIKGIATLLPGNHLWILLHRIKGFRNKWWPQDEGEVDPKTTEWEVHAYVGQPQDVGYDFELAIITVDEQTHKDLKDYQEKCEREQKWPPISMPKTTSDPILFTFKKASH